MMKSNSNEEIKMPFNVSDASKETVDFLIKIGILYEDETGIHVSDK